jgi:hypothetical protein
MPSSPKRALAFHFDRVWRQHLPLRWPAGTLACVLLAGCDSDFEPYGELSSLRVLAIESVPASPAPGETATLTPLLYVPGAEPLASSWSWCPVEALADEGGACPLGEEEATLVLGTPVRYDLGSEPFARFEHRFAAASIARFCSGEVLAAAGLAIDCSEGLPVQIRYVVRSSNDVVESVRRLRLRFSPEQPENQNPVVDGISALVSGAPLALDDEGTVVLPRDTEVELVAAVATGASEPLSPPREGDRARERLVLTWFVEAGEARYERTSFVDGELPLERALRNGWTLPSLAEHAAPEASLIVVARDERGGVGWRTARVALGGAP